MDHLDKTSLRDWLPIRAYQAAKEWRLDWCWFGQQRLTQPFFNDSVSDQLQHPFNLAFRRDTGLDTLASHALSSPGVPLKALIFHASRCGSTLLAQMLASLDSHIVLSEPPVLDRLLQADSRHFGGEAAQLAMLQHLVSAFGQRRSGQETALVIKLDAWHVFSVSKLIQAFPDVPRFFLYRDPVEIAVSQLREPAMYMVPGMVSSLSDHVLADLKAGLGYDQQTHIANTIGRILQAGADLCEQHGAIAINYSDLSQLVLDRYLDTMGVMATEANIRQLQAGAQPHTKRPHFAYSDDRADKQGAASEALRAALARTAGPAYERLQHLSASRQ